MRLRDQVALTLPTLFLRIILGVIFLWAGTGKFMGTHQVSGDAAARLANLGIMPTPLVENEVDKGAVPELESEPDHQSAPLDALPDTNEQSTPDVDPAVPSDVIDDVQEAIENTTDQPTTAPIEEIINNTTEELKNSTPTLPTDLPTDPQINQPDATLGAMIRPVQHTNKTYSSADFPDPMQVQRLYSVSLMISKAANPGLTAESMPIDPILPAVFGSGPWPKVLAWAAAITEIVAGAFLILGLLTRFSALSILSVMLVALWLTQFGPAVIQSNDALLGFIPRVDNPWSSMEYTILLWQLSIAAMSMAVFFMGSGSIGVDRLLFKPKVRDPYEHGDQKSIKNVQTQQAGDRGEFDRTPNPTP